MKRIKVKREMVGNRFFDGQTKLTISLGDEIIPVNTNAKFFIEKIIELPQGISEIEVEEDLSIVVYIDSVDEWVSFSQKDIRRQSDTFSTLANKANIECLDYLKDILKYTESIEHKLNNVCRKPIEKESIELSLENLLK